MSALKRLIALLLILNYCCAGAAVAAADRPNIVLIMADDMGFSDLGCYGGEIDTPNLDRLADGGLRFTQFYNTGRCCPTRASLLTGLYSHQAGIGHMTGDYGLPSYQGRLNEQCVTIAEALKPAGYQTLATGKWHVGGDRPNWPLQRGFDRYFGTPDGGGFYFPEALQFRKLRLFSGNEPIDPGDGWYVTDLFTDRAVDFLNEASQQEAPFFLYFAHIAPHWPLQAREEDVQKYLGRYSEGWEAVRRARFERQQALGLADESWTLSEPDPQAPEWKSLFQEKQAEMDRRMAVYAAQIEVLDRSVGRIVETLEQFDQLDNTLILFLSDNGCSAEGGPLGFDRGEKDAPIGSPDSYSSAGLAWANACNTPFRKYKIFTHEGGVASPLIAHWPNGIAVKGEFRHQVGHVIDLMPTILDVSQADYPEQLGGNLRKPLEGISLVSTFGENTPAPRTLFWEHEGNRAVRQGDLKLVAAHKQPWRLHDLSHDRVEQHDLTSEYPEKAAALKQAWDEWAARAGVEPWPVKKKK